MRIITALFLLALTGAEAGDWVQKRWARTWNLDRKENWKEQRMPCAGAVATLPRYPDNRLFLGDDVTVGSLELPIEGEIMVGDAGSLVLDHARGDQCVDTEWTHHGLDHWWDPESWSYPGFPDATSLPVPHLHRVPCTRDSVFFDNTTNALYTVHLMPPVVSITSLSIGNKNFTTSELAEYMRTPEGKLRFRGASSNSDGAPLYVESPGECVDVTGCMCGSEQAASVICRIMSAKCQTPQCDNPIEMTGFCCPVCGAEVTINHAGSLPLKMVEKLLHNHLQTAAMRDVRGYVAKMSDQLYHVYFTAANVHGNYKEASTSFKIKFNAELNAASSHQVLVSYAGAMKAPASRKVAPQYVAVTLVTLTICLMIGAAVYYFRKRRVASSLSFMFRRLESDSRRVSVVSDVIGGRRPSNASSVFAYSRESGLRFFNPIFNQSMASLAGAGVTSVINEEAQEPLPEQVEGEHENPMYTAFQNMLPEEQQASEEVIRERERILEAAGQVVASMGYSQRHNKEKRLSNPSGDNLESIKEEKVTKDSMHDVPETYDDKTSEENEKPKDESSTSSSEQNLDILQLSLEKNAETTKVDTNFESNINEDPKKEEETGVAPEEQISKDVTSGLSTEATVADDVPSLPLSHPDQEESLLSSSSSSSSSSDDDASDALKNLEGFTPLVDLRFKK